MAWPADAALIAPARQAAEHHGRPAAHTVAHALAEADVFDALASERVYEKAWPREPGAPARRGPG